MSIRPILVASLLIVQFCMAGSAHALPTGDWFSRESYLAPKAQPIHQVWCLTHRPSLLSPLRLYPSTIALTTLPASECPSEDTLLLPIDPLMHAFFTDYLIRNWKLTYASAEKLSTWVLKYSAKYEVDPMVQLARVLKESSGRHYTLSSRGGSLRVKRGGAGEIGFSQISPSWIGKTVEDVKFTRELLFEPEGNIAAGIILYKRYEKMSGDYLLALSRYNSPGSRRPNAYARRVDNLFKEIQREYLKFRLLQPTFYSW